MFQSTRPVRGATCLNIRLPIRYFVSIHAPRAGRDFDKFTILTEEEVFQSTRPVRGATTRHDAFKAHGKVSIHAPRAGRDPVGWMG